MSIKCKNGFGFDVLERCHKDGNEFLNHIVQVTGDETWVSFANVETKQQSKQWMQTQTPNKPKKFKQMSASMLMVEFMLHGTTICGIIFL
jgi:hypothetical protein